MSQMSLGELGELDGMSLNVDGNGCTLWQRSILMYWDTHAPTVDAILLCVFSSLVCSSYLGFCVSGGSGCSSCSKSCEE